MKKYLPIIVLIAAFGAACAPSGDIKINIDKKESAMTATYGVIVPAEEDTYRGRDAVFYKFYLSTFDMKIDATEKRSLGPDLTSADQKKIYFNIVVLEDEPYDTKLREGVYSSPRATHVTPGLEMGSFRVYTFANGEEDQWARLGGTEESFVNIISVKDDVVQGEITFIDGEDSVKGKFTAKLLKKDKENINE